jgi:hypothetical protein
MAAVLRRHRRAADDVSDVLAGMLLVCDAGEAEPPNPRLAAIRSALVFAMTLLQEHALQVDEDAGRWAEYRDKRGSGDDGPERPLMH